MFIIIQARMSSKRLPGKVLTKIKDKYLLDYLLDRLNYIKESHKIIIATSNHSSDDEIFNFCKKKNIICFRGDLNNVSKRYFDLINFYNIDSFVRICGDSPLIDPNIINNAITLFRSGKFDLVTNKYPRSFPVGQTIEIINSNSYKKLFKSISNESEEEHVSLHLYNNPKALIIKNIKNSLDCSNFNLAIDDPNDLKKYQNFLNKFDYDIKNMSFEEVILNY